MTREGGVPHPTPPLESASVRALPSWFYQLTQAAGIPVLLALLLVALLLVLPSSWSYRPPGIRRVLSFTFDIVGPLLAAFLLASHYLGSGGVHWLLLGVGLLGWGTAGFVNATHLPGDPWDTGMTIQGISTALLGLLSLLAVPFAGRASRQRTRRGSLRALVIAYSSALVLITLITWIKLSGQIEPFYAEETGSTIPRLNTLSLAFVLLAASAALLYLLGNRRHLFSLRWCAGGLALIAIGSWGQTSVNDLWGLLAWTSRAVLALGVVYLLTGSILATREPHSGGRVPLAALLRSEAQFRAFFENAGVGAAQILPDTRFVRVNDRYCEITGYSREELLRMSPLDLDHPEEHEADRARVRRLFVDPDYTYNVEKRYVRKDGCTIWVHVAISLVRDPAGEPLHAVGIIEDITERVQEERRASRYTRVVAGINRMLSEAMRGETEDDVRAACLGVVLELTGSPMGFIREAGAGGEMQDIVLSDAVGTESGLWGTREGRRIGPGECVTPSLCDQVIKEGVSVFTNEPASYAGDPAAPTDHTPLTAFLGVPLRRGGAVVGIVVAANREGGYTPEQQADLEELAPAVVQALWKKRAEQELQQHLVELEVLNGTNQTLLREINHRVKNNLSAILGLLYAEQRRLRTESMPRCETVLDDLSERIRNLAAVHTLLSAGGWRPLRLSELAEEVISAAAPISLALQPPTVEVPASPVKVTPGQAHHLALVIGELVMNTLKHGRGGEVTRIRVDIGLENGNVRMVYHDNGPGFPDAVVSGETRSVGLGLLHSIVTTSLRGSWSMRNDRGAITEICFPMLSEQDGDNIDEP